MNPTENYLQKSPITNSLFTSFVTPDETLASDWAGRFAQVGSFDNVNAFSAQRAVAITIPAKKFYETKKYILYIIEMVRYIHEYFSLNVREKAHCRF